MTNIYKLGYILDRDITNMYVFAGSLPEVSNRSQDELLKLSNTSEGEMLINKLFTPEELSDIVEKNIKVTILNAHIHDDDTIETVKGKIILHCNEAYAYEQLYLFGHQLVHLDPETVYQNLTQNGKLELSRPRLLQFFHNIKDLDINVLPIKDVYTYDDIFSLDLAKQDWLMAKPIGQKFLAIDTNYPYTVNPYNVTKDAGYDDFLVKFADSITSTTNKSLIMDFGGMHNNYIQICIASDVLASAEARGLSQESTIRIYFPFLAEREIKHLSELVEVMPLLIDESIKLIDENFKQNVKSINLYHEIQRDKSDELDYTETGIKTVHIKVHPNYSFKLPLEFVFKLLHATKTIPLIKYNPGKRQEKVYRMYANRIATNGKKIPYLSRSEVMKVVKTLAKNNSVAAYIKHDKNINIICEFNNSGSYSIIAKFKKSLSSDDIDSILKDAVNPVVTVVKDFLMQSGYTMNLFDGLYSNQTEIVDLEYTMIVPIKKKIKLESIMGCLSGIFNVISSDISNGAIMRYKRVSNFNEMDSSEAYIVESLNLGMRDKEVIQGLMQNFQLEKNEAESRLISFVTRLQLVQDAFEGSHKLRIKNNPGFLTTMRFKQSNAELEIHVSGINKIDYLQTIPIYLDSFIRISQSHWGSAKKPDNLNKLCKSSRNIAVEEKEDIVAPVELPDGQRQVVNIVADELIFEENTRNTENNAMLDILMMSDGDDDDDESEEDEQLAMGAGSDDDDAEDIEKDLTGMSLANPNPFFTRLKNRDPTLFLVDNEGSYKSYSRICPWNVRRQPVILTDAEKETIDAEHKGSYTSAVKYGTSKDKQFWYICPKYWSLRDQVSLTEEQVKSGKYGDIIPHDAKKVPPGGNIITLHKNKKDSYPYPGFQKQSSHPNNKCIPCCFKSWDSPAQKKRRDICKQEEIGNNPSESLQRIESEANEDYIVGPDKFPLAAGRLGYLPMSLQKFLRTDNKKCQISQTNPNLRENHPCFVRYGVATSREQSFIGAIAALWADYNNNVDTVLSIEAMKEVFIDALNLDNFMMLQNSNLIEVFDPDENTEISLYKDTKLYQNTNLNEPSELALIKKVARSYENFRNYLRDDQVTIDYTYVWDLICMPNERLFRNGLNLTILELKQEDMTDNVEIICPSNHYSSSFFDSNKQTGIIMKMGNYYEPIIQYEDTGDHFLMNKLFYINSRNTLPNLRTALEMIKLSTNDKCHALPSMPKVYKFKRNISLERLVFLLQSKNFKILSQVLNYNGKVVALLVSKESTDDNSILVPCNPSAPMMDLTEQFNWFDDENIGRSYEDTIKSLDIVYKISKEKIPCKPKIKILEDGLIVGILTETNQFIPISPPSQDIYADDLKVINDSNYAVIDRISITEKTEDNERIEYNKRIELETSFFNIFRNTVRILLGQFDHRKIREEIESLSQDAETPYLTKLRRIDTLLKELMRDSITFTEYDKSILSELGDITSCYTANENCKNKQFCLTQEDGTCALIIPKDNLINNQDNEVVYYGRLADEIVRYSRIKSYMFQPKAFLTFSNLKYNLDDDEIIILQTLLTDKPDYYDGLVPAPINSFTKNTTFDTNQPLTSQVYSKKLNYDKAALLAAEEFHDVTTSSVCLPPTADIGVAGRKWKGIFEAGSIELVFPNNPPECTFDLILTLINQERESRSKLLNKKEIREILTMAYEKYYANFSKQIHKILANQGKRAIVKKLQQSTASLDQIIMSEEYYATNLDIWLLADHYDIPLAFYSGTNLKENGKEFMIANSSSSEKYYFVKCPAIKQNEVPNKYRLLIGPDKVSKIPILSLINPDFIKEFKKSTRSVESFITEYKD